VIYFVIVAYDISDDTRRNKVAKVLSDYGGRVQYSVFECLLDKKRIKEMEKRLLKRINKSEDRIRIYVISRECEKDVIIHGEGKLIEEEEAYIL